MLTVFLLLLLSDPQNAMKVRLGDAALDVHLKDLKGRSFMLDDVVESTFCIFLSLDCPFCMKALPYIQKSNKKHDCAVIFIDDLNKVQEGSTEWGNHLKDIPVFLTALDQLTPHNIRTFPAILAYRDSQLALAFHGELNEEHTQMLVNFYEHKMKKQTAGE